MSTNSLPQTLTDREIDALVAEKVMGWTQIHDAAQQERAYRAGQKWFRVHESITRRSGKLTWVSTNGLGAPCSNDSFHPSEDFSAAFQVVEKMRELGWGFHCDDQYPGIETDPGPWWVEFEKGDSEEGDQAHGTSFPAVICAAALKALGIEVSS